MITRQILRFPFLAIPRSRPPVSITRLSFHPRRATIRPSVRCASHSNRSPVDERIEEIQELYATARDEFEIASEETIKKTVYAADDRAAAAEELTKLKTTFDQAVAEPGGEEIRSRIGGRIRELERAVEAMEEMAMED